jgi:hypothetical protein
MGARMILTNKRCFQHLAVSLFLCLTIPTHCVLILSPPFCVCSALLFGGDPNPAHPKHIGSIDPTCNVADVVKGKENNAVLLTVAQIAL